MARRLYTNQRAWAVKFEDAYTISVFNKLKPYTERDYTRVATRREALSVAKHFADLYGFKVRCETGSYEDRKWTWQVPSDELDTVQERRTRQPVMPEAPVMPTPENLFRLASQYYATRIMSGRDEEF